MESREALEVAVEIYKKLENSAIYGRSVEGVLEEEDFYDAEVSLKRAEFYIRSDNSSRKIEYSLPSKNDAFFAKDLNELIESPDRQINSVCV